MSTTTTVTESRAPHVATGKVVAKDGAAPAKMLYDAFEQFNGEHFDAKLGAPLVLITPAGSARTLGDYCAVDVHGLESRIRISVNAVNQGMLFALDVLLHEQVHAWQHEVDGDLEAGYRGHGPRFAAKCNEIGAKLGLPEVGVKGRGGKPDCAYWPMCVRPERYYGHSYKPPTRRQKKGAEGEQDGGTPNGPDVLAQVIAAVGRLDEAQLAAVGQAVIAEVEKRMLAVIGDEASRQVEGRAN